VTRSRSSLALVAAAALLVGCRGKPTELEAVEFGVLFGGDIQDRETIPLELDPARQELAVRVTFREPVRVERVIKWELERPTTKRGSDAGLLYAAELGEIRARPGERRAESKLKLRAGDLPGTWRVRVRIDGDVVLERSFRVSAEAR
jgi:hypothetical protein